MVSMLYAIGMRVGELINLKVSDLNFEEKTGYVKQGKGRKDRAFNIPESMMQEIRGQAENQKADNQEFLFTGSQGKLTDRNIQKIVRKAAIRAGINKSVHPHLFRHSSATYYANKLNRQELCMRYGWKFSSDMPDIYISRAGMENKELDEKFTQTELGDLKYKLEKQEQQNNLMKERQERLEAELNRRQQFDPVLDKLLQQAPVIHQLKKLLDSGKKLVIE